MSVVVTQFAENEAQTLECGRSLALICQEMLSSQLIVIYLYGQLGAGKTTFARGFLRGLGVTAHIKSPTYTLVESYPVSHFTVHHFDLYRLKDSQELEWMGIHEYFVAPSICLIEWPEVGGGVLPTSDITCMIDREGEGRLLAFSSYSKTGNAILGRLAHEK